MGLVLILMFSSIGLAVAILVSAPPPGRARAWQLRTSWAMWVLQPAVLIAVLLIGLTIMAQYGYDSSNAPDDVQSWLAFAIFGALGLALLAGTILGGLAWRTARLERPPTSRRGWALAATLANALWLVGGAWLIAAPAVAVGLDVLVLVLASTLLLWPSRRPAADAEPRPDVVQHTDPVASSDEHLVG